jgi:hypothetical protein
VRGSETKSRPLPHAPGARALLWHQESAGSSTRDTRAGHIMTRIMKTAHVCRMDFRRGPLGYQDHPLSRRHSHRQDHPRDRLRRHQLNQRARHRAGPDPTGPRALIH